MKRFATTLAFTLAFTTIGVAFAVAANSPSVTPAAAGFALGAKGIPIQNQCLGSDGVTVYNEVIGTWTGSEVDNGSSPYLLNGTLTVKARFEVNGTTGLGIGTGTAILKSSKGKLIYKGKLTMVDQIINQNNDVIGRGFLNAKIYSGGVYTGTNVWTNFALLLNGQTGGITGDFGGTDATIPNLSAEYNNQTCT